MAATPSMDLLDTTLKQTGALIAGIKPEQATLSTPCSGWDVRTLVNHTVSDLALFKTMVDGGERPEPNDNLIGDDWLAAYDKGAAALMAAWRQRGALGKMQLGRLGELPATWAIGQHMADIAAHGWDIARATGQPTEGDPTVGEVSLAWARQSLKP